MVTVYSCSKHVCLHRSDMVLSFKVVLRLGFGVQVRLRYVMLGSGGGVRVLKSPHKGSSADTSVCVCVPLALECFDNEAFVAAVCFHVN